jgi:hypothetical protein
MDRQTGAVPAGGSAVVRHIYAMAANPTDLAQLKADAVDVYVAPTVTLTQPADVATDQATVTGSASAMGTLTGVKVNGIDATVDGQGNWAATIPLTLGANAISVVATNSAGLTGQASGSVTYSLPSASGPSAPTSTTTPVDTPAVSPLPVATIPVTTTPANTTLDVALHTTSTHVAQTRNHTTKLALTCTGTVTGTCTGTVTMTKVLRVNGVRKQMVLGTAAFTVKAGKTVLVPLTLTAFGKKMLSRNRQRLVHAQVRVTQAGHTSGGTSAITRTKQRPGR